MKITMAGPCLRSMLFLRMREESGSFRLILVTVLLLAVALNFSHTASASEPSQQFRVVGYLPDYRLANFEPQSAKRLTDLILFSAELAEDGSLDLTRFKDAPWPELLRFKTQYNVRLLLTIGGWERSENFAAVAASPEKRQKCVEALVKLCLEKRLDGIDLDWEHPKGSIENDAYARFLSGIRTAFDPHGLVLSATVAMWQRLPAEGVAAIDCVQVMAYDAPKKHSTFAQIQKGMSMILDAGVPPEKIVLGLPLYGRHIKTGAAMTYDEIVTKFSPKADEDQVGEMYFNGPNTIRRKVRFALESKFAGVMVWELGQDVDGQGSLLNAIQLSVDAGQGK